jgi:MFS family permease
MPMDPGARTPTVPVALAGSAAFINLYATQPLLPLLARTYHASPLKAGLTVTAPTIVIAICAPFIGGLADRLGLRRVIVGSASVLAAATLLAATSRTLEQFIAWRLVQGVMTPGIFAGVVAYIHETWPAARAGRGTAAYMTGTILGGFTGRLVAGLVASVAAWQWSLVALGTMSTAVAVVLFFRLPDERKAPGYVARTHAFRAAQVTALFRNHQLLATFGIGACILFTQVGMLTYVTFYLAAPPFHLSTAALGWLFLVYVMGATVVPFCGAFIDHYGHRVGLSSAMGMGACGVLLTLIPWLPAILLGLAITSTGVFIAQSTTSAYIGAVTKQSRGLAVGVYSTFYYIGGSLGGSVPAPFWTRGGWPACVVLVVTVQLFGVVVALTPWQRRGAAAPSDPELEAVP